MAKKGGGGTTVGRREAPAWATVHPLSPPRRTASRGSPGRGRASAESLSGAEEGFPKRVAAGAAGGRGGGTELRGHGAAGGRGDEGVGQGAEHEWGEQEGTGPRMASVVSSSLAELAVGGGELSLISQGITSMAQVLPLPAGTDHGKVTALNLHYNALTVLERLSLVPNLTSLRLSSNEIARMAGAIDYRTSMITDEDGCCSTRISVSLTHYYVLNRSSDLTSPHFQCSFFCLASSMGFSP